MARLFDDNCGDSYDWAHSLSWWSVGGDGFGSSTAWGGVVAGKMGATGNCLQLTQVPAAAQDSFLRKNLPGDYGRLIYGFRFLTTALPLTGYHVISALWDNTATILNSISVDASGAISLWRGGFPYGSGIQIGSFTVPNVITVNTWVYIELDIELAISGASFTLRANSQQILTSSGIQTSPNSNGARMFSIVSSFNSSSAYHYFDDIYVNDTSGTTNNGFDGDQQMLYFPPTSSGQFSQQAIGGTAAAATNWQSVNQTVPDDDTTYVYAASTGLKDTYKVAGLPSNVSSIVSVTTILDAKTDTSGLGAGATLRPLIGNGTTHANGTSVSVNTSYIDKAQYWGQNPITSAAWSLSDWSTIEVGHERTA